MDYLRSRRAVIDALGKELFESSESERERLCDVLAGAIADIKAVLSEQPERTKGKWINRHYIYSDRNIDMKVCSECQYEYSYDAETGIGDANFCPNCGVDMRGGNNERLN